MNAFYLTDNRKAWRLAMEVCRLIPCVPGGWVITHGPCAVAMNDPAGWFRLVRDRHAMLVEWRTSPTP